MKRNQNSGLPLEFTDSQLSDAQYKMRVNSHKSSTKYESRNAKKVELPTLRIGDRVYVKSDGSKSKARDPYIVLQFVPNKNEVLAQKLTDRKNKKNIITIQIQNLYRVDNDQLSNSSENEKDSECRTQKQSEFRETKKKTRVFYNKRINMKQCFFCIFPHSIYENHSLRAETVTFAN